MKVFKEYRAHADAGGALSKDEIACLEAWDAGEIETALNIMPDSMKPKNADKWDEWYARLPDDLKRRLSFHDFKRLGDLFAEVFNIER